MVCIATLEAATVAVVAAVAAVVDVVADTVVDAAAAGGRTFSMFDVGRRILDIRLGALFIRLSVSGLKDLRPKSRLLGLRRLIRPPFEFTTQLSGKKNQSISFKLDFTSRLQGKQPDFNQGVAKILI